MPSSEFLISWYTNRKLNSIQITGNHKSNSNIYPTKGGGLYISESGWSAQHWQIVSLQIFFIDFILWAILHSVLYLCSCLLLVIWWACHFILRIYRSYIPNYAVLYIEFNHAPPQYCSAAPGHLWLHSSSTTCPYLPREFPHEQ